MDTETEDEIEYVKSIIAVQFRQIEQIGVAVEALTTALATVIDDARPDDAAVAEEWLGRLRDVAVTNVEMRAATLRLDAMAQSRTDPEDLAAAEEHKRSLVNWLTNYFDGIARPAGEVP